jgi:hypothetical protein
VELFQAQPFRRLDVPVDKPAIRDAVVSSVHFALRVGPEGVELDTPQALPASAGGIRQMHIVDGIWNRGENEILVELARGYGIWWI